MTTPTISPLRQRLIEDMNGRNLGLHSQRSHIHSCRRFAGYLKRSPDTATADDIACSSCICSRAGRASAIATGS